MAGGRLAQRFDIAIVPSKSGRSRYDKCRLCGRREERVPSAALDLRRSCRSPFDRAFGDVEFTGADAACGFSVIQPILDQRVLAASQRRDKISSGSALRLNSQGALRQVGVYRAFFGNRALLHVVFRGGLRRISSIGWTMNNEGSGEAYFGERSGCRIAATVELRRGAQRAQRPGAPHGTRRPVGAIAAGIGRAAGTGDKQGD
jgi:hypothetical protein